MGYQKLDKNGNYRDVNPKTGRFFDEDEYPLGSGLGQTEHQLTHTNKGKIYDRDEVKPDIVDEAGVAVISEDETKIKEFIKNAISLDNLVATFTKNSHETLLKLLALQNNKHPLKKGGAGIAYRTDALIMHCKMEFTTDENIVFDAILGTMSSFPDNETYRIEPSSFTKLSKYNNEKYLYDVFRRGTSKLVDRHLKFEDLGEDGKDDIVVPWFDILRYHKKDKKNEVAFIEFRPTDFFKDLALCSGLVHGAYGSIEVTTQLRGKYTIALYWFLENRKRYKEYPNATPGIFEIALDEFKHQFSIPETYKYNMIEERVLKPAYESINEVAECDFTFEYEVVRERSKVLGYRFNISEKNYIESTAKEIIEIEEKEMDPLKEQIGQTAAMLGITFTPEEIDRVFACAKRENKDIQYLMQILIAFKSRVENKELDKIEDRIGYICAMIAQGANPKPEKTEKSKNKFNKFSQRDYDMDELERQLLKH